MSEQLTAEEELAQLQEAERRFAAEQRERKARIAAALERDERSLLEKLAKVRGLKSQFSPAEAPAPSVAASASTVVDTPKAARAAAPTRKRPPKKGSKAPRLVLPPRDLVLPPLDTSGEVTNRKILLTVVAANPGLPFAQIANGMRHYRPQISNATAWGETRRTERKRHIVGKGDKPTLYYLAEPPKVQPETSATEGEEE
jgi:hypothetical protein